VNEKLKIYVQIKKIEQPDGKELYKATVPLNLIFEKEFDAKSLEKEISNIEKNYSRLITNLKALLARIHNKNEKDGRVLFYWKFGDEIINFINHVNEKSFHIEKLTDILMRDVGASIKFITRCERFKLLYPDVKMIDPKRSFWSYIVEFESGYLSHKSKNE